MKNSKTLNLKAIRPSSIIEANYHKKLSQIVKLTRKNINDIVADFTQAKTDPYYVNAISDRFRNAFNEWGDNFLFEADRIAKSFTDDSLSMVDRKLKAEFRRNKLSIDFQMTDKMQAKLQGKVLENVRLISDLPHQYLSDVQGAVMRSIERGANLQQLSEILQYRYGIASRRANNIAKDQANKAMAVFNRQRQVDVGIREGIWEHSGIGRDKRPSHVKAGRDKLVFDLEKGAYIDGEWIFPGELVNCHCTFRSVLFNGQGK